MLTTSNFIHVFSNIILVPPLAVSGIRSSYEESPSPRLIVTWDPPSGQCPAENYYVVYFLSNRDMCQQLNGEELDAYVSETQLVTSSVEPYSEYTISVRPHNNAGAGPQQLGSVSTGEQGKTVGKVEGRVCFILHTSGSKGDVK